MARRQVFLAALLALNLLLPTPVGAQEVPVAPQTPIPSPPVLPPDGGLPGPGMPGTMPPGFIPPGATASLPMATGSMPLATPSATSSATSSLYPDVPMLPETATSSPAPRNGQTIKLRADHLVNDKASGIATAFGNVRLEAKGAVITTDTLSYNQKQKLVFTEAPFTLVQQVEGKIQTVTGTGLRYDLGADQAVIRDAKLDTAAKAPGQIIYITAKEMTYSKKDTGTEFEMKDGTFTTCDFISKQETPHYHLESHAWMKFVPDQYAMGADVTVYLNNRPVFWVPFFWIPLNRLDTKVQLGKNDVEGLFAKTSLPYNLGPKHNGTMFLNGLEFKSPGSFGIEHSWRNEPDSSTYGLLYGLPSPDTFDYVPGTGDSKAFSYQNPWIVHGLDPSNLRYFQDYWAHFKHSQRMFGMLVDGEWEDRNLYQPVESLSANLSREAMQSNPQTPYRLDYSLWNLGLADARLGTTYSYRHSVRDDRGYSPNHTQSDVGNVAATFGGFSINGSINRNETYRPYTWKDINVGPTLVASRDYSITPTVGESDNLNLKQQITNEISLSSATQRTRNENPGATATAPRIIRDTVVEIVNYTHSLGWGNLAGVAQRQFNLAPTTSDVVKETAALGYLEKLPELTLTTSRIWEQGQPFTLSAMAGRYVENSAYDATKATNPEKYPVEALQPVNRLKLTGTLDSKPYQLVPGTEGMNLSFGSSKVEQRLYSTGHAEYTLAGNAVLSTNLWSYLTTSLTYHRDYTPEATASASPLDQALGFNGRNSSPFKSFENLGLARSHTLSAAANAAAGEAFRWSNNLSYNYETLRYSPYTTSITVAPNRRANLSFNTGYSFAEKPYLEFNTGKWSDLSGTLHLQSSEEGFGGIYGQDNVTPGWGLDTSLNYSIDAGEWRAMTNTLRIELGTTWQSHWGFSAEGRWDVTGKRYELLKLSVNKDLHDWVASVSYDKQLDTYWFSMSMIAFQTNLINWNSKSSGFGSPASLLTGITGGNP